MSRFALLLLLSTSLLFLMGLLMIFNTSAASIIDRSLEVSTHSAFFKQISYSLIGIFVGLFVYKMGYQNLIRYSPFFMIVGCILLICVFVPGIGVKINGAKRWIGFGGSPLGQPSELMKVFLPVAFIHWLLKRKETLTLSSFLKMLFLFFIPIVLILVEPDNGSASILCLLLVTLFLLSRIPLLYWAMPLFCLMLIGGAIAYQMPHVRNRIEVYIHPEFDLRGKGHQPYQAKIATGSGGILGRGLGESLQKLNYLPEARNDYIAAIFAEEMGFLGVLFLILLYLVMSASGFVIAMRAQKKEAFLMASVLTFLISIQAFLNLGVVSGLLPSKGMALPFFSQGGSSLITNIVCLFILLDISRKEALCLKS